MDLLGADFLRKGFADLGLDEPALLREAKSGFYTDGGTRVLSLKGGYEEVAHEPGEISLAAFKLPTNRERHVLESSRDASLIDVGHGVAVLEFHSKMNSLGEGVVTMVHKALDRVEQDGMAGLVIGNEDPRTFTAGADLSMILKLIAGGDWKVLENAVETFQKTSVRIRQSPFPVVSAPFGLTLGGGTRVLDSCR